MRFAFWRRGRNNDELDAEVGAHLEASIRERMERGASRAEAEAAARREFGNVVLVKEVTREMWGLRWLDDLAQDLRYGLRQLRRSPGFTAVAVVTLALGIGGNVAIFQAVDALLLKPLPYPEPERLVQLWLSGINNTENTSIASMPNFVDWRDQSRSFKAMAAYEILSYNVSGTDEPEQVPGMRASAALFEVLGVKPRLGRPFTVEEEQLGKDNVVVISDGLWRRRFGADATLVDKTIRINGEPRTLVGVMPPGFQFPFPSLAVWVPIAFNEADQNRGSQSFRVVARIRPDVSLEVAQAEIDAIGRRLEKQYAPPAHFRPPEI